MRSTTKRNIFLLIIFLIIASALTTALLFNYRQTSPIPRDISARVNFPLYYPSEFPSGFRLDTDSFSETNNVVTYTVSYESNKKLIFNIEALPKKFDFDGFNSKGKKIRSSLGDAYVGSLGNKTVVSITSDKSWLLVGVPSPIDKPNLETMLQSLKESQ